jgi:hypothetical protein
MVVFLAIKLYGKFLDQRIVTRFLPTDGGVNCIEY